MSFAETVGISYGFRLYDSPQGKRLDKPFLLITPEGLLAEPKYRPIIPPSNVMANPLIRPLQDDAYCKQLIQYLNKISEVT